MIRLILICFIPLSLSAQVKLLHYTETSGFDHQTRDESFQLFSQIALQSGMAIDDDSTGAGFNSLSNLQQYAVIIFSNTTGDSILDTLQRSNFEQYIASGGNLIGIHSATDTYRHSTANGTNTGSWDFYAELIGASVQQNPNHVNGQPIYSMTALQSHAILNGIPSTWNKAEEYYYWEGGYFNNTNSVLLKVEQTIGPNGLINSYDSARATTWFRELPAGNKIFYTSLGHDPSNFISDSLFIRLIQNAVEWMTTSTDIHEIWNSVVSVFPNPVKDKINIHFDFKHGVYNCIEIYSVQGNLKLKQQLLSDCNDVSIPTNNLPGGIYLLKITNENGNSVAGKFVVIN